MDESSTIRARKSEENFERMKLEVGSQKTEVGRIIHQLSFINYKKL